MIETAIVLPLVVMVVLVIVQMVVLGRDQLALWHLAREAARAAAVSSVASSTADETVSRLAPDLAVDVTTTVDEEWVRVDLSRRVALEVIVIGGLLGEPVLRASVTMRRE